ncbi:MAG: VWA domain-containing protein [Deltaproteobacteria bacterium]|nr:MAG: VWA domain-containing protein [Deltaproteobacteria bacterium]
MTRYALAFAIVAAACGGGDAGGGPGADAAVASPDTDGDSISDADEGAATGVDTDGDGVPDYRDDDADGDGIPDYREAGDADPATPPVDSDGDGIPDFRDTDSDQNGRPDGVDGTADTDGDGTPDFADRDDDGDGLSDADEIGPSAMMPVDTDGDGTPDFRDPDSDDDTIADRNEGAVDPDMDGVPSYLDGDSDGDCIPDAAEAGDADLATPPVDTDGDGRPDFLDLDADNDGLADADEDRDCDGAVGPDETSATSEDTDGDGVSDLVETAAGTDPRDSGDNPQANGDFVFVVPYQEPPDPDEDDLDFSTDLQIVDVYVLIDRSGSMSSEINSVRNNMQTVLSHLSCPPLGTGDPASCIPDLWSGAGTIGYIDAGGQAYTNHLDIQPNPSLTGPAIPTSEPGGCCKEALALAGWSVMTGKGSAAAGCTIGSAYGDRATCAGSPAGASGIGYPCFRNEALPVLLFATDEAFSSGDTANCPSTTAFSDAANAIGAKVIGIQGNGGGSTLTDELRAVAAATGAVDSGGNALVFNGADASAAGAIEDAIRTLANNVPLDVSATPVDDASDAVDAVAEFVDRLETQQLGTPACADGLAEADSDGDGYADLYIDVLPGTPVCWRLVPKVNTTVMATDEPQLFRATVRVFGDGVTLLDERDVYFLVPPDIPDVPID